MEVNLHMPPNGEEHQSMEQSGQIWETSLEDPKEELTC